MEMICEYCADLLCPYRGGNWCPNQAFAFESSFSEKKEELMNLCKIGNVEVGLPNEKGEFVPLAILKKKKGVSDEDYYKLVKHLLYECK